MSDSSPNMTAMSLSQSRKTLRVRALCLFPCLYANKGLLGGGLMTIMWLSKFFSGSVAPDCLNQYASSGLSEHFVLGREKLVTSSPLRSVCFFTSEGLTWDEGSNDVRVF